MNNEINIINMTGFSESEAEGYIVMGKPILSLTNEELIAIVISLDKSLKKRQDSIKLATKLVDNWYK